MKKLFKVLYFLPIIILAACSSDEETEQTTELKQKYTMTCNTGNITRVTYEDIANTMYCNWEVGDVVTLKNASNETFDFTVESVDENGVAIINYVGYIPNANSFTGTATYAPRNREKEGIQTANDNTEHLKYSETMVAQLNNQKIDGANLNFTHPETAVYKVIFKAPAAFDNATLTMTGAWDEDSNTELSFSAAEDDVITAYVMHKGGRLDAGSKLKFILEIEGGNCFSYTFSSVNNFVYENGKYWIANFSNKKMEWEGIDLGLSVKWAVCNLGATVPEDVGDYYRWGELDPYNMQTTDSYKWYQQKVETLIASGCFNSTYTGYQSYYYTLKDEDDVATVKLGKHWRMPTKQELEELVSKCTWTNISYKGQNGVKVVGPNKNKIFLPKNGYKTSSGRLADTGEGDYWSSSVDPFSNSYSYMRAYYLVIDNSRYVDLGGEDSDYCEPEVYEGLLIRPVTNY